MAKIINLEYLYASSQDPGFAKKMIELFLETFPPVLEAMQNAATDNNFDQLSKTSHKAKSSVLIIGMEQLSGMFREIEMESKAQNTEKNYQALVAACIEIYNQAEVELKEVLQS